MSTQVNLIDSNIKSRLNACVENATAAGIRVDGLALANHLLNEKQLEKLEQQLFSQAKLQTLKDVGKRIEFIYDGKLPGELREESNLKDEVIFRQELNYDLCKACRLCIEVCPKDVYMDDGFGKPDRDIRRSEECTGSHQCGQCVALCPEKALTLVQKEQAYDSTIFVLLENAQQAETAKVIKVDFHVQNPLSQGAHLKLGAALNPKNLAQCHATLGKAGFYPILELMGYTRDFLSTASPELDLANWAKENGRDPELVTKALGLLYQQLSQIDSLLQGKYRLDPVLHRIIDEIIYRGIEIDSSGGRQLLASFLEEAYLKDQYLGAKRRPIGGILPTGTSLAWKTPYGEEIPEYVHLDKCLGPECGLCVTQCPEGGGGANGAIRMIYEAPRGTIGALVRGFEAHLIRYDMAKGKASAIENLTGQKGFTFEVNPDYCKACGLCISCCPHNVIEPAPRAFDLRQSK